jgi:hypothetical protein
LRIADVKGKDGVKSCFYGFHGAVLHAVIAESNGGVVGAGDAL